MTSAIQSLAEIASDYDAIVFDQWGVLHDGSTPYPGAIKILQELAGKFIALAVLSNSGKRAEPNARRIADMGFETQLFHTIMTSGEALWSDINAGRVSAKRFYAIERAPGDAADWAADLAIDLVHLEQADAILLMGLPDETATADWQTVMDQAHARNLPIFCSNPDRASPRASGLVISPGALAHAYVDRGGAVTFYGKPHLPIFHAVEDALKCNRLLMVGDSLEHDIAGAQGAGWDSLLITGGLYAAEFQNADHDITLARLVQQKGCEPPTYTIGTLQ